MRAARLSIVPAVVFLAACGGSATDETAPPAAAPAQVAGCDPNDPGEKVVPGAFAPGWSCAELYPGCRLWTRRKEGDRYMLVAATGPDARAFRSECLASGAATAALPPPTVPCDEVILRVGSGRAGGYRVVLGLVSVPPAYLAQIVKSGGQTWPYWRKAGLVIRGGSPPVSVSVPRPWRNRAAITWGNGTGIVSALRIASCPSADKPWNAYAGGFYLRSRSACVPLVFRVARRAATVRFGLGQSCP
jgi:hypothetical protein